MILFPVVTLAMGKLRYSILAPSTRPVIDLKVTPAKMDVLDFMQDFDILPSSYIKAQFGTPSFTKAVLGEFAKAHLIRVPKGYSHINARYRPRPLELTELGRRELEQAGRLRKRERMNDHFSHAYLRSIIEHSFRQAAKEDPLLTLHTERDILEHPDCPEATRNESNPSWFTVGSHTVRPDGSLFGYEYRLGEQSAFMFFHGFEADRATERQKSNEKFEKKTIAKMFEQYAEYLARAGYKEKYGLTQVTVPIITIGEQRMRIMLETLKEAVPDERVRRRFIFKYLPDFLHNDPLPPPTGHMVTEPWTRVDGPFSIIDTLKQTAARKGAIHTEKK